MNGLPPLPSCSAEHALVSIRRGRPSTWACGRPWRLGATSPEGGAQHDRELEALGPVHGEDLDGVVVAVDAARQELGSDGVRRPTWSGSVRSSSTASSADAAVGRPADRRLHQLEHVVEVGEVALATGSAEHPLEQPAGPDLGHERSQATRSRGTAPSPAAARPGR